VNYYNEFDPYAAQWLRNLIEAKLIPNGVVDERSIVDVRPGDLRGFIQCHFFAGIAGWPLALQRSGWPASKPVWSASLPCFPAGTSVLTERGYLNIEDVVVGDSVLTHNGRWRKVQHTGSGYGALITLKGQGHHGIKCTEDHPFLTDDGSWVNAGNMLGKRWATVASVPKMDIPPIVTGKSGYFYDSASNRWIVKGEIEGKNVYVGSFRNVDDAIVARREAIATKKISARGADGVDVNSLGFARFLGYWVGDGWVTGNDVAICGSVEDKDLIFGIMTEAGIRPTMSLERTSFRAKSGSVGLSNWLRDNFSSGASNKKIPAWLHGQSDEYRAAFLDGYYTADGHEESPKRGGRVRRFTTVSKKLAIGVRVLLNQSGLSASITLHTPKRINRIEGRTVNERPFYRVTSYNSATSFKFFDGKGFGRVRSVSDSAQNDVVYNLAVEEDESYTADGIIVHNCQPFSAAGLGGKFDDDRHLYPVFGELVSKCKPEFIMGEQVSSKDALDWFDHVSFHLEGEDYAVGAIDTSAASVGSPHIRQRLYWAAARLGSKGRRELASESFRIRAYSEWDALTPAYADRKRSQGRAGVSERSPKRIAGEGGLAVGMADASLERFDRSGDRGEGRRAEYPVGDHLGGMAHTDVINGDGAGLGPSHESGELRVPAAICGVEDISSGGMEYAARNGREQWRAESSERGVIGGPGVGGVENPELPKSARQQLVGGSNLREQKAVRLAGGGVVDRLDLSGTDSGMLRNGAAFGLADSDIAGLGARGEIRPVPEKHDAQYGGAASAGRPGPVNGFWRNADWLKCRDDKWRPVEPGSFPLASGISGRVGRLRAYGNAICVETATEFIRSIMGKD
jgi:intein/homing endonuclease